MQHEGKLYLTEEEWDARWKKHEASNNFGGGSSLGGSCSKGGHSHGRGHGGRNGLPDGSKKPTGDECRKCGKVGHWARECRSKPKKEQVNVAQEEEEAPLLFI
jgi:hypothetical protein